MVGQAKEIAEWLSRRRSIVAGAAAIWAVFKFARWPLFLAWDFFGTDGVGSVWDWGRHHLVIVIPALLAVGAITYVIVYRALGWVGERAAES